MVHVLRCNEFMFCEYGRRSGFSRKDIKGQADDALSVPFWKVSNRPKKAGVGLSHFTARFRFGVLPDHDAIGFVFRPPGKRAKLLMPPGR